MKGCGEMAMHFGKRRIDTTTFVFGKYVDGQLTRMAMKDPYGNWEKARTISAKGIRIVDSIQRFGDSFVVAISTATGSGVNQLKVTHPEGVAWLHDMKHSLMIDPSNKPVVISATYWFGFLSTAKPEQKISPYGNVKLEGPWPEDGGRIISRGGRLW
jgi:hypothetical protein